MAKITDLPPELVQRIIDQVLLVTRGTDIYRYFHIPDHRNNNNNNLNNNNNSHTHNTNHRAPSPNQNNSHQPITPPLFTINDFTIFSSNSDFNPELPHSHSNNEQTDNNFKVSWPDGLPSEPLVYFSLVNRTFQQCAQETLFRHVALYNPWQASLFLRTLNRSKAASPILEDDSVFKSVPFDTKGKRRLQSHGDALSSPRTYRRLNRLGDHVRSLRFMWMGPASMGKGGGSLICDLLESCPLLENIVISTALLSHCKEPLFKALETKTLIKEFFILKSPVENPRKFLWQADEVLSRLFTKWNHLETVEFTGLSGRSADKMDYIFKSIPTFNCSLKFISLTRPNLAELELRTFLNNSKSTMNTLQISYPTPKLDRAGLFRILADCTGSELESLTIQVGKEWHPITSQRPPSNQTVETTMKDEDPNHNPHLIDILFKSSNGLRKIKSLSIGGPLASSKLFNYLPDSIEKIAWEDCSDIHPASFAKFLSSWSKRIQSHSTSNNSHPLFDSNDYSGQTSRNLPNLKCCSVGTDDFNWKLSDRRAVENALRERDACFHSSNCQAFFPPAWFRPPDNSEDEQGNTEEESDLMSNIGWPRSEADYNPHEDEDDEDEDDDDDEDDDEDDEDEDGFDDEGGGGRTGNRSARSRNNNWGRIPPPPMLFPGLFGLPMTAYTFPLNGPPGTGGSEGAATAWLFGGGTGPSSTNRTPHPPHPNRSSSSTNNNTNTSTESTSNRNQNRVDNQASSSSARPSSPTNNNNNNANSNSRPKSPGLFGPGFQFGKMFEK